MPKRLIIDGKTYEDVTALKATDANTGETAIFPDTSDATAVAADISVGKTAYVNGQKVDGTNTGTTENDLDGLVDGTLISFTMPSGKTSIAPYRFYNFTSLETINLGGVQTIGSNAFCGCNRVKSPRLPSTIISIGRYAFGSLGSSSGTTFNFIPTNECVVDNNAFHDSMIAKLEGKFSSIGAYAFFNCVRLKEVSIESSSIGGSAFQNDTNINTLYLKCNGSIGSYSFSSIYNITNCSIDKNSVITSIGNYAFSRFACNRSNPSSNIITLDFSKSKFTSIPQYGFGSDNSSYRNKYMKVLFPSIISTINAYAFRYTDNCEFYFTNPTPPTLSVTTAWSNATNYKIFVPYTGVNAYKEATNWATQVDYIKGFSASNSFIEGATLPELSSEGYALTWYSDPDCTMQITTVDDPSAIYYCIAGTEKIAYGVKSVTTVDCSVIISDGTKTYSAGEGVLTGTVLTITGIPDTEGYIPYMFQVNGQNFTSGDTFVVEEDLSITAIYYDGHTLPINPIFGENIWAIIFQAFRAGIASQFWKAGDTKSVTLTDGNTYTIRIADMQEGRYALTNGGTSNGVLEFVECIPTSYAINSTQKESYWTGGGWAMSDMLNTHMETIYNMLPDDMKAAISEITLSEYSYTAPTPRESTNKLFLPAETEIFKTNHRAAEGGGVYPKYNQFDWYAQITTADNATCVERQKHKVNTTFSIWYWLRSPCSGVNANFCAVYSNGSCIGSDASSESGVAPCFAI